MRVSPQGLALIQRFEGFSATPYRCPAGYQTIGYGHVMTPGESVVFLSEADALLQLETDARIAAMAVMRLIRVALSQPQFDALVSFTFNLGAAVLQRSTLRQCVNREDHAAVPRELGRWVWAGGRRLPGLIRRRAAEAAMYRDGGFHETVIK